MKLIIYFFVFLCILEARKKLKKREKQHTKKLSLKIKTKRQQQALPKDLLDLAGYPQDLIDQINPEVTVEKNSEGSIINSYTECTDNEHDKNENCFNPGKLYGNFKLEDASITENLINNLNVAFKFLETTNENKREELAYELATKKNGETFTNNCPEIYKAITLYTSNNEIFCRLNNFASAYPEAIDKYKEIEKEKISPGLLELLEFHKNLNTALEKFPSSEIPKNIFTNFLTTDPLKKEYGYLNENPFSVRGGKLNILKDFLENGGTQDHSINIDGFLSTSFDVEKALEYLNCDQDGFLIAFGLADEETKKMAGAMIQECSVYRGEAEFLVKSNTHWKYKGMIEGFASCHSDTNKKIDLHIIQYEIPTNQQSDTIDVCCRVGDYDNGELLDQDVSVQCEVHENKVCDHQTFVDEEQSKNIK